MKFCALAGILSAVVAGNVHAQDDKKSNMDCEPVNENKMSCAKPGFYLHGALGLVKGNISINDISQPLTNKGYQVFDVEMEQQRLGYKFNLGYAFNSDWAVELGTTDLGDVDVEMGAKVSDVNAFYDDVRLLHPTSAAGATLSGVYTYPLNASWTINGRLGVFDWDGDFKTTNLISDEQVRSHEVSGRDLYWGGYLQYLYSPKTRFTAEWERYNFDDDSSDMFSVGMQYFFGSSSEIASAKPAPVVKPVVNEPAPTPVVKDVIATPQNYSLTVYFANDSASLDAKQRQRVNVLVKEIGDAKVNEIRLAGHTSKVASKGYNQRLSQRRVKAVKAYINELLMVEQSAFSVNAFGEQQLIDSSGTEQAAKLNRRVEIEVKVTH